MEWFCCPSCGQKLVKYEPSTATCCAVFIKCKKCKNVVEIKFDNAKNIDENKEKL